MSKTEQNLRRNLMNLTDKCSRKMQKLFQFESSTQSMQLSTQTRSMTSWGRLTSTCAIWDGQRMTSEIHYRQFRWWTSQRVMSLNSSIAPRKKSLPQKVNCIRQLRNMWRKAKLYLSTHTLLGMDVQTISNTSCSTRQKSKTPYILSRWGCEATQKSAMETASFLRFMIFADCPVLHSGKKLKNKQKRRRSKDRWK